MKTNRLLNIIGGVLVAASSIFYVGGCQSLSEEEKAAAKGRRYIEFVNESNAKERAKKEKEGREYLEFVKEYNAKERAEQRDKAQNGYQTSPPQNNLEKDAEKAITHGVGEFIGEALIYEYLKK
ncbi:MAG: hypothetical protein Q8N63_07055 [Nanoarchaeota archaeon]|nr:hypothetical protein [Nanoarchaeota archaeon]